MATDSFAKSVTEVNIADLSLKTPGTSSPELSTLENRLQHRFSRLELLRQALTHTSQSHERSLGEAGEADQSANEQLEFLGDAVLGFVTAEELCRRYPNHREGQLSKFRAHLVSQKHLIKISRDLKLGDYLRLGKGEEKSGGRNKPALLVDALEAVIAAIYLDGGMGPAKSFIVAQILDPELRLETIGEKSILTTDYKSALQEKLQAEGEAHLSYALIKEDGPEHRKTFTVEAQLVVLDRNVRRYFVGSGRGPTKKSAEQESAKQLLEVLAAHVQDENKS